MRFAVLCIVALGACAKAAAPLPPATSLPPLPPPGASDADPGVASAGGQALPFPDGAAAGLTAIDTPGHEHAREAAKAGDWHEAKRWLARLVFAYPEHAVLLAQYNAVSSHIEQAQAASKAALEALPMRTPQTPPFAYTLVRSAPSTGALPKLVKIAETPNHIIDSEAWFEGLGLHLPLYVVEGPNGMIWAPNFLTTSTAIEVKGQFAFVEYTPSGRYLSASLPLEVPAAYGALELSRAIDSKPYLLALYGERVVVVFDVSKKVVAAFDLVNYATPPSSVAGQAKVGEFKLTTPDGTRTGDLTLPTQSVFLRLGYALAADGVLYVQHFHNGYTKESKGQTGYVTALDLATGDLLWRSAPQVANGENFLLVGGGLVCGHGFTNESRTMFVLDRATGAKRQTLRVSTTPEIFLPKDGSIHVRGYRSDFVFAVR